MELLGKEEAPQAARVGVKRIDSNAVLTNAAAFRQKPSQGGGSADAAGALARKESKANLGMSAEDARKKHKHDEDQKEKGSVIQKDSVICEHQWEPAQLAKYYGIEMKGDDLVGLPDPSKNLEAYGRNVLTPPPETPLLVKFIAHQVGGFSLLLWGGAILCFIVYGLDSSTNDNLYLGIVLAVVVFFTGCFAFYQEYKAEATMAGFKNLTPDKCTVIRAKDTTHNGKTCPAGTPIEGFDAGDLVRGDVVKVKMGQKVPADIYILSQSDMKVDNAALTGESEPLNRGVGCTHESAWETKNVAFYGTFCVQGSCTAVCIRTGDDTMVGQIAHATLHEAKPPTTMEQEIEHFIKLISVIAFVIGISFFTISLVIEGDAVRAVIAMIGIIVANVPEGLLATVTVALTLTATKMAEVNVLVKSNQTIETLGSITTIASDKTGTLTQNRMTATHAIHSMKIIAVDNTVLSVASDVAGGAGYDLKDPDFLHLQRVTALCATAYFKTEHEDETQYDHQKNMGEENKDGWTKRVLDRETEGDASESGMLKFNEPLMRDHWWYKCHTPKEVAEQYVVQYCEQYHPRGQIPFNSTNKWMMTMHEANPQCEKGVEGREAAFLEEEECYCILVKGAPEKLMDACTYFRCSPEARASLGRLGEEMEDARKKHSSKENTFDDKFENGTEDEYMLMRNVVRPEESLCADGCNYPYAKAMVPFTSFFKGVTQQRQMKLAGEGERVLGMAQLIIKKSEFEALVGPDGQKVEQDTKRMFKLDEPWLSQNINQEGALWKRMTFVGMMSLVDPPRLEVPDAIKECRTAGIQVVMVTGDHPVTAKSISERVGILDAGPCTISDWVAWQKQHIGEPGFMTKEGLASLLKDYIQCASDDEVSKGYYAKEGIFAGASLLSVGKMDKPVSDAKWPEQAEHNLCKDPKAKWWMGYRLHDECGLPIGIDVVPNNEEGSLCYAPKGRIDDPIMGLVVAGPQIDYFNDNDWRYALSRTKLTFARTLPAQKQQIVATMQQYNAMMCKGALNDPIADKEDSNGIPATVQGRKAPGWARLSPYVTDKGKVVPEIDQLIHIADDAGRFCTDKPGKVDNEIPTPLVQKKVVAVTGDGVNDSPALKKADCGIAMGTGSDVAQDAGDMILMDDKFSSVVIGIKMGRLIFDNLKKSIAYTLTSNIPEITPFLAFILLQIPIPLETVMILCIDLGTDMLPAISLAYEIPESDIMRRKPRNQLTDRLVNQKLIGMCYGQIGMIQAAAGFCCYFCVFAFYDILYDDLSGSATDFADTGTKFVLGLDYDTRIEILRKAQTSFLISIIVAQWTDVMICKTRVLSVFQQGMYNFVLNVGLVEELVLGMALVYVPFCHEAFKTKDLDFEMWCYGVPFSILILVYDECRKYFLRRERAYYYDLEGEEKGEQAAMENGFIHACTYY